MERLADSRIASCDGLVCSAREAFRCVILGPEALIITPFDQGVPRRATNNARNSASAIAAGASKLVIGRPITEAKDPCATFEEIVNELI